MLHNIITYRFSNLAVIQCIKIIECTNLYELLTSVLSTIVVVKKSIYCH